MTRCFEKKRVTLQMYNTKNLPKIRVRVSGKIRHKKMPTPSPRAKGRKKRLRQCLERKPQTTTLTRLNRSALCTGRVRMVIITGHEGDVCRQGKYELPQCTVPLFVLRRRARTMPKIRVHQNGSGRDAESASANSAVAGRFRG